MKKAKNRSYLRLLKKMYRIELVGDALYRVLAAKVKDPVFSDVYRQLSENECRAGRALLEEMDQCQVSISKKALSVLVRIVAFFFALIPQTILSNVLKNILKKRIYSGWGERYHDRNPELWCVLIEHENVQHQLLTPYWQRETEEGI